MTLVGSPFLVTHSPQQIVVQGSVIYVSNYDSAILQTINISNPASLQPLQSFSIPGYNAIPVIVRNNYAYVGCYASGGIERIDISNPSDMQLTQTITGINYPQRFKFAGRYLLVTGSNAGGSVYQIDLGVDYQQQIVASDIFTQNLQASMLNATSESVTNNLSVQGAAYLGVGSTVGSSLICTAGNALCSGSGGITALTGDVVATGPGSSVATVDAVHATSGTLNGVTIGNTMPATGSFTSASISDAQNGITSTTTANGSSGSGAQAVYFANSDVASLTSGATSSTFSGLPSIAYINAHTGNSLAFLFHDSIMGSFTSSGFNVGYSNQFQVDGSGDVTANTANLTNLSIAATQNGITSASVTNTSSGSAAQAVYFANSDVASFTAGATSSTFIAGLAGVAYLNVHTGNAFDFLFHDVVVGSFTSSGFNVGSSNQFQVDETGHVSAASGTFIGGVTAPQIWGPTTAPVGSCTVSGAWVLSQDGHATFCASGTWVTKI
jgi:hypothetical protein